jgi:hypothetical protein
MIGGLPPNGNGRRQRLRGFGRRHQLGMRLTGEQVGPLGVGEHHLKLRDLLEFRQRRG